jgi:hypothetical protein
VVCVAFFSVSISLNFPFPRHAILKKVKLSAPQMMSEQASCSCVVLLLLLLLLLPLLLQA